jgi:hypothetical protein
LLLYIAELFHLSKGIVLALQMDRDYVPENFHSWRQS